VGFRKAILRDSGPISFVSFLFFVVEIIAPDAARQEAVAATKRYKSHEELQPAKAIAEYPERYRWGSSTPVVAIREESIRVEGKGSRETV
jgi:hypothetical protein